MLPGVIVGLLLVAGCGKSETANPPSVEKKAPAKSLGITAECPLCDGHKLNVTTETPKVEFEGKTYYFCSKDCQQEFASHPADSVAKLNTKAALPATGPTASH
jgi:YHS domain-containing protein